jgi:hypothetical protein
MHLLLPAISREVVTILICDKDLGGMQLESVPEDYRQVVVVLREAPTPSERETMFSGHGDRKVSFVVADRDRLPIKRAAADEIIEYSMRGETSSPLDRYDTLAGFFKPGGTYVGIRLNDFAAQADASPASATRQSFFVRPSSGHEYFVTTVAPAAYSGWPFAGLPMGIITVAKQLIDMFLTRTGLTDLSDTVMVDVVTGTAQPMMLSGWVDLDNPAASKVGLFAKVSWTAMLFGFGKSVSIVKFPLIPVTMDRMQDSAKVIEALSNEVDQGLQSKIPRILGTGKVGGQCFWEETFCKGITSSRRALTPGWKRRVAGSSFDFLLDLHYQTQDACVLTDERCMQLMAIQDTQRIVEVARRFDPAFALDALLARICKIMSGRRIPLVRTHGDFWPGNVLVNRSAELEAVLDWDASKEKSWPVCDLLHLLAHQNKRRGYWHCGPVITGRLMPMKIRSWESQLVDRYFSRLEICPELWVCFNAIYWLERTAQWMQTNMNDYWYDKTWVRRNIVSTAPKIIRQMDLCYS